MPLLLISDLGQRSLGLFLVERPEYDPSECLDGMFNHYVTFRIFRNVMQHKCLKF